MMRRLMWRDVMQGLEGYIHYRHVCFRSGEESGIHTHDFPEIFWVEYGRGVHLINGDGAELSHGCIVIMRPEDAHGYRIAARQGSPMRIANLAFEPEARLHLIKRYGTQASSLFNPSGRMPFSTRLMPEAMAIISEKAEALTPKHGLSGIDSFLIELMRILSDGVSCDSSGTAPDWLRTACARIRMADMFVVKGVPAFVELCGRSPEHVSRTFMKQESRN